MATDDFYIVKSWMIDDLGLSGVELQCFAIIWSLSRGKKQMYIAGTSHLVNMTKKTKQTILTALKSLCEKGYIKKIPVVVNNIERKYYKAISEGLDGFNSDEEEGYNNLTGENNEGSNNFTPTGQKIIPPIIESNNKENKKRDNNKSLSPKNKRFVKPTIKDIEEYIKEKDMHFEAERFFDYYESKGWMVGKSPMKDWKAACRTWESQRKHEFKEEQTEESTQPDLWQRQQEWFKRNVPNIAHLITKEMYGKMRIICIVQMDFQQALLNMNEGFEGDFLEAFREEVKRCAGG